jgi:hypothetical protein
VPADAQPFVVDNTNPTPPSARRYVEPAREAGFRVVGYLVEVADARRSRATRRARRRVPAAGVVGPAGGCCARRPRRASTSSGTPPPARTAAGASSRCSRHRRCSARGASSIARSVSGSAATSAAAAFSWHLLGAAARRRSRRRRCAVQHPGQRELGHRQPASSATGRSAATGVERRGVEPLADEAVHRRGGGARVGRRRLAGRYLPVSTPWASGDHTICEMPLALAQRDDLGLGARHSAEYCGWLETNFATPGSRSASWICSGGHSLKPM